MTVGAAQQGQLVVLIVIFLISYIPFSQIENGTKMILKTVGIGKVVRWFEFILKLVTLYFASQWTVYALRSSSFGNVNWTGEVDVPNSPPGQEAYYNYTVMNGLILAYLVLVKELKWWINWLAWDLSEDQRASTTKINTAIAGWNAAAIILYVTVIEAFSVAVTTIFWKTYNIKTADWKFVASFWIISTIVWGVYWLVLLGFAIWKWRDPKSFNEYNSRGVTPSGTTRDN